MELNFGIVEGLPEKEQEQLNRLKKIYDNHRSTNRKKRRYYNGRVTLNEVNLGIAIPNGFGKLQIGCAWGAKTVDVLASRSMFDGFVGKNGENSETMDRICRRNKLIAGYKKACKVELTYGSVYAAVYGGPGNAHIRFYSPHAAAAAWDAENEREECGFVFDDGRTDESDIEWNPAHVTFHTETDIWELDKDGGRWYATRHPHNFGRPLMVALAWDATSEKPFGQSRLKEPIRRLIEGYVRTVANATIGLEFSTTPQKYLMGATDDQIDALISDKFKQYIGSVFTASPNNETGTNPVFGQLAQGNIGPHVEMMRILSTQFSAATGLSVTDTGVVNDANPTSSDAILAQTQTLVTLASDLNTGNGDALYTISQMALAVELKTTPDQLPDEEKNVIAHFKNPAMPSVAVTADAAIKIASSRQSFANTDVFLEMIGFDQADIRRIKAQEQKAQGTITLKEFINGNNSTGGVDQVQKPNESGMPEGR